MKRLMLLLGIFILLIGCSGNNAEAVEVVLDGVCEPQDHSEISELDTPPFPIPECAIVEGVYDHGIDVVIRLILEDQNWEDVRDVYKEALGDKVISEQDYEGREEGGDIRTYIVDESEPTTIIEFFQNPEIENQVHLAIFYKYP